MSARWFEALHLRLADRRVDLDEVLHTVVDAVAEALEAERSTLYLHDPSTGELVSRAAHLPEIAEIRLRRGEGIAGWVARTRRPMVLGRERPDPRWSDRVDAATGYRTTSLLCAPVLAGDDLVGVLQVLNRRSGDFDEDDLDRLGRIARDLAALLDDTSLRSQLRSASDKSLAFRFNFVVGQSPLMNDVYERVSRAAASEATVLVRGETGTGKSLLARAIHDNSARRAGPLVQVDCAALPASLIENELFGHERGAYTGAGEAREGQVAAAEGGTLFLDEIGDLPLDVQGKLLRLIEDRTYLRIGGSTERRASVRFVCATHTDLEQRMAEGAFRSDLYYRIRVVELEVPPLRHRGHVDLDRLVDHFVFESARRHGRTVTLSPAARAALHGWSWPGNVRELEHCLEAAVLMARSDTITPDDLPLRRRVPLPQGDPDRFVAEGGTLAEVERAYCRHVLASCDGNRTRAAQRLGIGRNTLARKLADP
ncbi:MAG: sigma-54-dependent Fis family transcriptional regulator [Myxococcota bacterium]